MTINAARKPAGPKKKIDPAKKRRRVLVLTIVLSVVLVCVLSVSATAGYMLINASKIVGGEEILNLNEYMSDQTQTSIVYTLDADGKEVTLARLHGEINRIWVESDDIPKHVKNAFVALEDKRFYDHPGVDWRRTGKAIMGVFIPGADREGGSTITQQLIKNLTGDSAPTFVRKFNEILKALNLSRYFSKDTVLTTYLNTLYLDQGCYGVETAAEYYFGKTVGELNIAEAACLAAITKAPRAFNPIINYEKNRERMEWCLAEMEDQGLITKEELLEAENYKIVLRGSEGFKESESIKDNKAKNEDNDTEIQSYYVDYIIDQVMAHLQDQYGYTKSEAFQKVYYGGLKIHAAVDLRLQNIMEDVYYNRIQFPSESDTKKNPAAQSSMTVVDYSGRLLGIVGQAGPKTGNRVLNIATDYPRQPGSSIKPLSVYAPAINEKTVHWSSKFPNAGFMLNGSIWPKNYEGMGDGGYVTVQSALPPSLNTVPAQILKTGKLSFETAFNYLQDAFHFTSLGLNDKNYAPLATGGMEYGVTTLEMAAAYATFGNGGKYFEPYSYYKVTNYLGNKVLLSNTQVGEQVLDPSTAEVMLQMLKTVVTSGTASSSAVSGYSNNMFGKTGTTTDNYDRWFVGGTPYAVCAVWFGYKVPRSLPGYSYNPAGRLFKTVMDRYHKGLDSSQKFPYVAGSAVQRKYCTGSGNLASATCASTKWGWYRPDYIPSTCVNCNAYGDGVPELTTVPETTTGIVGEPGTGIPPETSTGEQTTTVEPTTQQPTVPVTIRPPETQVAPPPVRPQD